jgi:hypothetical protein
MFLGLRREGFWGLSNTFHVPTTGSVGWSDSLGESWGLNGISHVASVMNATDFWGLNIFT